MGTKKRKFNIDKLEERIAPFALGHGNAKVNVLFEVGDEGTTATLFPPTGKRIEGVAMPQDAVFGLQKADLR